MTTAVRRGLLLLPILALGLAAGTFIGFAADSATTTVINVRTNLVTEYLYVTETVESVSDPREHKIQLPEAARFGKTYCTAYAEEIVQDEVSDSGVYLKAQAIGERCGATSAVADAITEACSTSLPYPSDG